MGLLTALAVTFTVTVVPVVAVLFAPRGRPSPPPKHLRESLHQRPPAEATAITPRRSSVGFRTT